MVQQTGQGQSRIEMQINSNHGKTSEDSTEVSDGHLLEIYFHSNIIMIIIIYTRSGGDSNSAQVH